MSLLTEEQNIIAEMAQAWADENAPIAELRRLRDSNDELCLNPTLLADIAAMGWTGALASEDHGGSALDFATACIIVGRLGRNLAALPLTGSAIGAVVALSAGSATVAASHWLPRIADGSAIAAVAIDEAAHHDPSRLTTTASRLRDGYSINGRKIAVHEGLAADVLIVVAEIDRGEDSSSRALFVVPSDAKGIARTRRVLMDSRGYADIEFEDVIVDHSALIGGADEILRMLDAIYVCIATELFALSERAFEMTLEYLKVRVQFGQVIGSFQALQHRAAELHSRLEYFRPIIAAAATAFDAGSPDRSRLASLAKAISANLANLITREMIQLHGGIALTDEFDAGFYIKRARVLETSFGSAAWHRERYATFAGF